jgi:hypothetical protein
MLHHLPLEVFEGDFRHVVSWLSGRIFLMAFSLSKALGRWQVVRVGFRVT